MKVVLNKCWGGASLSKKAQEFLGEKLPDYSPNLDVIPRHHPVLVECIEKLGNDASGRNANLVVVDVPYTKYILTEYDGQESIQDANKIIIDGNDLEYRNKLETLQDNYWFVQIRFE